MLSTPWQHWTQSMQKTEIWLRHQLKIYQKLQNILATVFLNKLFVKGEKSKMVEDIQHGMKRKARPIEMCTLQQNKHFREFNVLGTHINVLIYTYIIVYMLKLLIYNIIQTVVYML